LPFVPPLFRAPDAFFAFPFEDFFAPFDLDFVDLPPEDLAFDFPRLADLLLAADGFALELFFAGRFAAGFARFFEGFLALLFDGALALAATALTAFLAAGAAELLPAARPASAPITPPTTAPTGPATLPRTAPVAAPAVCFEIGGISIFSEDEADGSVDG
jgi:hypothetical protein